MRSTTIILPGIGGSGEAHWQTLWQHSDPSFKRFQPASWDQPDLADWLAALDRAVAQSAEPPLLVAHSLACLLVVHWAARRSAAVRGALLVAVPDPQGPEFPAVAAEFGGTPERPLRFPALIVASTDDPHGSVAYARSRAVTWNAGLVIAGALGHINAASGIGVWPQGVALLEAFAAGTRPSADP